MALLHIPFEQINADHLNRLITAKVPEARNIDYKMASYGNGDADHAEFLADVSSFANTAGGDIVIGMAAKAGVPTGFAPFTGDADKEVLRLESIARSGLQPRISNLRIKTVAIADGHAILIRVPRSYNPPHRIVRLGKGQNRFWARSSAGKYEPNVDELRTLFLLAPQLADRIRDFRVERVAKIVANETPVTLQDEHRLIIHIVPFSAFDVGAAISIEALVGQPFNFPPLGSQRPSGRRINVDGMLMLSNADENATRHRAYIQVFRSGAVESVASSILKGERPEGVSPRIRYLALEEYILQSAMRYLPALNGLGVEPPYAFLASLIGMTKVPILFGDEWHSDEAESLDRDQFHFTEIIVESLPASKTSCAAMLRPLLDQLANAGGRPKSPSFGDG